MTIRTLSDLAGDLIPFFEAKERISVDDLLTAFHERGFGFFLFLFALPAALPVPAVGIGTILGLPLLFLTAQLALGRHTLWLPEKVKARSMAGSRLIEFMEGARPWLKRLEFLVRPRLGWITQGAVSRFFGFLTFVMSVSVLLPLPLTNTVPSLGIALVGIGMTMRDGLAILGGAVIGCAWIGLLLFVTIVYGPEGVEIVKTAIKSF